jgi:beta-lactamase class A
MIYFYCAKPFSKKGKRQVIFKEGKDRGFSKKKGIKNQVDVRGFQWVNGSRTRYFELCLSMIFQRRMVAVFLLLFTACKTPVKTGSPQPAESKPTSGMSGSFKNPALLSEILNKLPENQRQLLGKPEHGIQIIFTQIDRGRNGRAKFTDHFFGLNDTTYFYPASTVKLPVAVLALQKLNELGISGLDKNSTMITGADYSGQTEVFNDPTAPDGRPTIAHYIKKILLVSDNDAYNRLYEFLGQEYINSTLQKMGYADVQIIHRLEISMTEDENRHTNPVSFFDTSGKLLFEKKPENSSLTYAMRNTKLGIGFMRGGQLVNEPFDFSKKNRLSLISLHNIVRSILFPEMVSAKQRFNLTADDYDFLRKYMSMMPQESEVSAYSTSDYWDTYVKFLFYGSEKNTAVPGIRIFNKVGDAYGFLIDAAYFMDEKNKVEFMLSAVIHCNSDGIFNDNKYEYDEIGFPFLRDLGKTIYEYELKRNKKVIPDLNRFRFNYTQ